MATMLDRESRREKILSAIQKEARLKVILESRGLCIGNVEAAEPTILCWNRMDLQLDQKSKDRLLNLFLGGQCMCMCHTECG